MRHRVIAVALAALLAGTSLAIDRSPIGAMVALFVLVVPFEKLFPRHPQRLRRPGLGTDLAYLASQPVLGVAGVIVAIVVGALSLWWVPGLAVRPLVDLLPSTLRLVVGFALFDMTIYWTHRWYHEVPFLWRFHAIHHSSARMDWVSGIRNHPLDGALIAPPFFFLLGAGFSAEFTGALAVVQIVTGLFLHANVRWRLRPLHRLVITPEFHHWHHANEPEAIHTNYSVFLPLWDIVFGTYRMPRDRRPSRYGVDEPIPTDLVGQLRHPMRGLRSPFAVLRHPVFAARDLRRSVRHGLGQLRRASRRPRKVVAF